MLPAPLPASWKAYFPSPESNSDSVLDQAAIIITAGRSTNLQYFSDTWVFLTRTGHWFELPTAAGLKSPAPRAAHASATTN